MNQGIVFFVFLHIFFYSPHLRFILLTWGWSLLYFHHNPDDGNFINIGKDTQLSCQSCLSPTKEMKFKHFIISKDILSQSSEGLYVL